MKSSKSCRCLTNPATKIYLCLWTGRSEHSSIRPTNASPRGITIFTKKYALRTPSLEMVATGSRCRWSTKAQWPLASWLRLIKTRGWLMIANATQSNTSLSRTVADLSNSAERRLWVAQRCTCESTKCWRLYSTLISWRWPSQTPTFKGLWKFDWQIDSRIRTFTFSWKWSSAILRSGSYDDYDEKL